MTRYFAASVIIAAVVLFLYVARILFIALSAGVLSIQKGTWERAKDPGAFWYNVGVMAVILLVPIIVAGLAAFTFVG